MMNGADTIRALYYLKKNGIKNTFYASCERLRASSRMQYCYASLSEAERDKQQNTVFEFNLKFSILVPMYETNESYAKAMIESVLSQTYSNFELILADASESDRVSELIRNYKDIRIQYFKLDKNEGISQNTNAALSRAKGDYVALLDHDDLLTEDALFVMAKAIMDGKANGKEYAFLYSDEDKCNAEASRFYEPNRKPDFNLDLLLSNNYICHFLVMNTALIKRLGFRKEFDGAQDFDLVLRAFAYKADNMEIGHIDRVLYHWRCHENSTAANPRSKLYAYEAGRNAVADFLNAKGIEAAVTHTAHNGFYRIQYGENDGNKEKKAKAVFDKRNDIGVIAGNIYKGNKIVSGILSEDGVCIYKGLNRNYSGYLHRAVLQQDCEAADIRNMKVCSKLQPLWKEMVPDSLSALNHDEIISLSLMFCKHVRDAGYLILWDPYF